MNLNELYAYAEDENVDINYYSIDETKGLGIKILGKVHIALNRKLIETDREERLVLAHELGHYYANAFYALHKVNNPRYKGVITKAENQGNNAALRLLVPLDKLKEILTVTRDDCEIASYFGVDLSILGQAVELYRQKGELAY